MDTNDRIITSPVDAHVKGGQREDSDHENGSPRFHVPRLMARKINNRGTGAGHSGHAGDDLTDQAAYRATRTITISALPEEVWP